MRIGVSLAALLILCPATALSKHPPKPPSQPPIQEGCITISEIYSHKLGILTQPSLDAAARNNCAQPVQVFLSIAYIDGRGEQFGNAIESATVAPNTTWRVYHVVQLYGLEQGRLSLAKIVKADAFRQ